MASTDTNIQAVIRGLVSPGLRVPPKIVRPPYAATGNPGNRTSRPVLEPDEIARMRIACTAAADILVTAGKAVAPGITTDQIDAIVHEATIDAGGYPSPLNYRGFPKSVCTSVNEVICHGIPDSRKLEDGDIVDIDVTIYLEGMHGDTNATFMVGDVDAESRRLIHATRAATHAGIGAVRPKARVCDIGRAIERSVAGQGLGIVKEFIGHGIGPEFHSSLEIPHYHDARYRTRFVPGMTFTVEPMITLGAPRVAIWDDGWTAVNTNLGRCAQFEHTLLVTSDGVEILTLPSSGLPAEYLQLPAEA